MLFRQLIDHISEKCRLELIAECEAPELRDVALLDSAQAAYDDGVVYFGYAPADGRLPKQCVLAGDVPEAEDRCVARIAPESLFSGFNSARAAVDAATGRGLYEELTAMANATRDIGAVLNLASIKLGNSLILSDMNFKIVASSTSMPVVDPIWRDNIKQGYCSYEFIAEVQQLESVRQALYSSDAIEVSCSESPFRKLSSKVLLDGAQVGFVLMIASETPVTPAHFSMLKSVSQALTYTIANCARDEFRGIDRWERLLYNLLIGAPTEALDQQLAGLELPRRMLALCVRQTRSLGQQHLRDAVTRGVRSVLPGARMAFHEGCAAVLAPTEFVELPAGKIAELTAAADKNFMRVGVSYCFSRIENFADHYRQAQAALDLSQRRGGPGAVAIYTDWQLFDLLSKVPEKAALGSYCHPSLQELRQYDHENGTEFYKTLEVYLNAGGSNKEAAERLYIHRNSLLYRLGRIGEIGGIDINDPDTRFLLKLSYSIDEFTGMDA